MTREYQGVSKCDAQWALTPQLQLRLIALALLRVAQPHAYSELRSVAAFSILAMVASCPIFRFTRATAIHTKMFMFCVGNLGFQAPPAIPISSKTVWPSGLRRWLKAPFRKGVGSNPTAVILHLMRKYNFARCSLMLSNMNCTTQRHIALAWLHAQCVFRADQQRDARSAHDAVEAMVNRNRKLAPGLDGSVSRASRRRRIDDSIMWWYARDVRQSCKWDIQK